MSEAQTKSEVKDVEIVRSGTQIIIPQTMTLDDAGSWITRKKQEEEKFYAINEDIDANPLEGAYAFMKAMAEIYGWTNFVPTPNFFGSSPPAMLSLEIDFQKVVQVPWGRVEIPNISGFLETSARRTDKGYIFVIQGEVKTKHKYEIARLAEKTRELVRTSSIYRGKAMRMAFPKSPKDFNPLSQPNFMDLSSVRPEELIFSDDVMQSVEMNIFTPIAHTKECREYKVPLKRGVLLEGPYGVGKTLTANVTAKLCVDNGWTFIYLSDVGQLAQAIFFARQYQPCAIFAEDIDRVLSSERDDGVNNILNTIDGVDTKNTEIMVILTTNHVDLINKASMRPGRLDAVISVRPPNAVAVNKLLRYYARGLIPKDEIIDQAAEILAGRIPAVIRETVERAKLAGIMRNMGKEQSLSIKQQDLVIAAQGMIEHLKLMEEKPEDERSEMEKSAAILAQAIQGSSFKANGKSENRNLA